VPDPSRNDLSLLIGAPAAYRYLAEKALDREGYSSVKLSFEMRQGSRGGLPGAEPKPVEDHHEAIATVAAGACSTLQTPVSG